MLIAERNGFLAGGKPTAKSYPFMPDLGSWDGIENAGFGLHESNPTQWVDLSGNGRHFAGLTCLGGFTDDAAVFVQRRGTVQSWTINDNTLKTIEIVGKSTQNNSFLAFVFSDGVVFHPKMFGILPTNNRGFQFLSNSKSMYKDWWSNRWSAVCTFESGGNLTQYYNTEVGQLTDRTSSWTNVGVSIGYAYSDQPYGYVGEICRVGLHSRALTADEIAANYALDKARFNLP